MSCINYRWNGDYWCDKKKARVSDADYYKYCRNYGYSDCPIYKQDTSSGCYLTTIICKILGKNDNDSVLDKMRKFRDSVLQKDVKYAQILKDYDTIGPLLSNCIANDYFNGYLSEKLYNRILVPISIQLDKKQYEGAVKMYENMTLSLINYYGLSNMYKDLKSNNNYLEYFDQSVAGHGYNNYLAKKLSL